MVFRLGWEVPCVFFESGQLVSFSKETLRHCQGADLYDHKTLADCGGRPATCSCSSWFGGKYTFLSGDCWKDLNKSPSSQNPTQGFVFLHIRTARYWSRTWAFTDSNYFTHCKQHSQTPLLLINSTQYPDVFPTQQTGSILVPKKHDGILNLIYTMTLSISINRECWCFIYWVIHQPYMPGWLSNPMISIPPRCQVPWFQWKVSCVASVYWYSATSPCALDGKISSLQGNKHLLKGLEFEGWGA